MKKNFLILLGLLLVVSPLRAEKVIAVVSAFKEELESIEAQTIRDPNAVSIKTYNGVRFKEARIGQRQVVFFLSGVSLVNAGITMQLAFDRFDISEVLFTGIAGGINPALKPGDVAIPKRWAYHGENAYFNLDAKGKAIVPPFYKPRYPNFGFIYPANVEVIRQGMSKPREMPFFAADSRLLSLAKRAVKREAFQKVHDKTPTLITGGVGVAGPTFMDNAEFRAFIFKVWKADCLDMESTAIAHASWINQKPFLIFRGMSDLAGGQTGINEAMIYSQAAAHNSAVALAQTLDKLSQIPVRE